MSFQYEIIQNLLDGSKILGGLVLLVEYSFGMGGSYLISTSVSILAGVTLLSFSYNYLVSLGACARVIICLGKYFSTVVFYIVPLEHPEKFHAIWYT